MMPQAGGFMRESRLGGVTVGLYLFHALGSLQSAFPVASGRYHASWEVYWRSKIAEIAKVS